MCGQHRLHFHFGEDPEDFFRPMPSLLEVFQGLSKARHSLQCCAGEGLSLAATNPVHLLGGVNQNKKQGEGTGNSYARFERQALDIREEGIHSRGLRIILASLPTGSSETFDCFKAFLTFEVKDDPSQDGAEPPHIIVQCPIFSMTGLLRKKTHPNTLEEASLSFTSSIPEYTRSAQDSIPISAFHFQQSLRPIYYMENGHAVFGPRELRRTRLTILMEWAFCFLIIYGHVTRTTVTVLIALCSMLFFGHAVFGPSELRGTRVTVLMRNTPRSS
jgi:hypothetical protein